MDKSSASYKDALLMPAERASGMSRKLGFLYKQGGSIKNFKKRLFVLTDTVLYYYESDRDQKAKGLIDLTGADIGACKSVSPTVIGKQNAFQIETPGRTWFLYKDDGSPASWIEAIDKAIEDLHASGRSKASGSSSASSSVQNAVDIASAAVDVAQKLDKSNVVSSAASAISGLFGFGKNKQKEEEERLAELARQKALAEERARQRLQKLADSRRARHAARAAAVETARRERLARRAGIAEARKIAGEDYVSSCIEFLKAGVPLMKHQVGGGKPHERFFRLSEDCTSLQWGPRAGKYNRDYPIAEMKWIVFGPYTDCQKRSLSAAPWRCFSLITDSNQGRSIDVFAHSDEVAERCFLALQSLIRDSILANDRQCLSRARLIFKRVQMKLRSLNNDFASIVLRAVEEIGVDRRNGSGADLKYLFDVFDTDHNGSIDRNEFLSICQKLGADILNDDSFVRLWEEADLNDDGRITYDEFFGLCEALFDIDDLRYIASLRRRFEKLDANNDDSISREEVALAYRQEEGQDMSQEDLDNFFRIFDSDSDGSVTWSEFLVASFQFFGSVRLRASHLEHLPVRNLHLAFEAFDTNRDGVIDYDEFVTFLGLLGANVDTLGSKPRELWIEADTNRDGSLDFTEFAFVVDSLLDISEISSISRIYSLFRHYDLNRDGSISRDEIALVYRDLHGSEASSESLDSFMKAFDANQDGQISWGEFLAAALRDPETFELHHIHPRQEKELFLIFDAADSDGSGSVSLQELVSFLSLLTEGNVDMRAVESLFEELDVSRDGQLSFLEFLRLARRLFDTEKLALVAKLRTAFVVVDQDKDNRINRSQVDDVIRAFHGELKANQATSDQVSSFLQQDSVSWNDFLRSCLQGLPEFR